MCGCFLIYHFQVNEKIMRHEFGSFGELVDVRIPLKETGESRGFAFVEFRNKSDAEKAIASLNGHDFHGRPIAIDWSLPKQEYDKHIVASQIVEKLENDIKKKT